MGFQRYVSSFIDELFRKWVFVQNGGRFAKGFSYVSRTIQVKKAEIGGDFCREVGWFDRFAKMASSGPLFGQFYLAVLFLCETGFWERTL